MYSPAVPVTLRRAISTGNYRGYRLAPVFELHYRCFSLGKQISRSS